VGLPLPGVTARIDCAPGTEPPVGELLVRGGGLFREYWGRAEATAESFTADGFFRTGGWGWVGGRVGGCQGKQLPLAAAVRWVGGRCPGY
jgi:long-subunit acyl-CoA synthetase (AMP-forming)